MRPYRIIINGQTRKVVMVGVSDQIDALSAKKECRPVISRVTSIPASAVDPITMGC